MKVSTFIDFANISNQIKDTVINEEVIPIAIGE